MYKKGKYDFWNTKQKKYLRKNHNNFNIAYCSNCGYKGHVYRECPDPKTSLGVIAFDYDASIKDESSQHKFLLICRKNSLGFVDFIRGKYNLQNVGYILHLIDQFTIQEKKFVINKTFLELWHILWYSKDKTNEIICVKSNKQKKEYLIAEKKFNTLRNGYYIIDKKIHTIQEMQDTLTQNTNHVSLEIIIKKSKTNWTTPEWGFPKGRRNLKESNLECSKREFMEETGLMQEHFNVFFNFNTLKESFIGTNNVPYKNIYYIGRMTQPVSLSIDMNCVYQASEISQLGFYNLDTCLEKIRPYNKEKIKILLEAYRFIKIHHLETKPIDYQSNVSMCNFKKGGKV
jgi:hypothetical protein